MNCPKCHRSAKVTETRMQKGFVPGVELTERTRVCVVCGYRWKGIEIPVESLTFKKRELLAKMIMPLVEAIKES